MRVEAHGLGLSLRRLFGLKTSPELSLAEDVLPVANVFSLDDPPYTAKRGGVVTLSVAAGGPGVPGVRLSIPAGADSTDRIVVRYLDCRNPSASDACYVGFALDGLYIPPVVPAFVHDWTGEANPTALLTPARGDVRSGDNGPGAPAGFLKLPATAGTWVRLTGPLVVTPGVSLFIFGGFVGAALDTLLYWDYYE